MEPEDKPAHKRFPGIFKAPDSVIAAVSGQASGPLQETVSGQAARPGAFEEMDATSSFDPPGKQRGRPTRSDRIGLSQMTGTAATSSNRTLNWSIYTVAELVRFRDEIGRTLPALQLKELDLEQEMLLQYHALRELQGDVLSDGEVPVNQRAQVANTVASTLKTLGDLQIGLYSSERFKDIENLLVRNLDKLPEDIAADFIEDYEKLLRKYEKHDRTTE